MAENLGYSEFYAAGGDVGMGVTKAPCHLTILSLLKNGNSPHQINMK
jgi:hypothetical protein